MDKRAGIKKVSEIELNEIKNSAGSSTNSARNDATS